MSIVSNYQGGSHPVCPYCVRLPADTPYANVERLRRPRHYQPSGWSACATRRRAPHQRQGIRSKRIRAGACLPRKPARHRESASRGYCGVGRLSCRRAERSGPRQAARLGIATASCCPKVAALRLTIRCIYIAESRIWRISLTVPSWMPHRSRSDNHGGITRFYSWSLY